MTEEIDEMPPDSELPVNKILSADVLDVLKQIPDNSIDCIITSPPYNKRSKKKPHPTDIWKRRNITYGKYDDNIPEQQYQEWQKQILRQCCRVIKPLGSIFYNHKQRIFNHVAIFPQNWLTEFFIKQMIVWDRGSSPNIDPIRFKLQTEYIFWIIKTPCQPKFKKEFFKYGEVWSIPPKSFADHPSPFTEEIVRRCMLSTTDENDIILDPFMGSGTTALVALKHNRKFIGIELNPDYLKMANKRIEPYLQQTKLDELEK